MTVQELITELRQFDPHADVMGTWESVIRPLAVYTAADGRVLIDADSCSYQAQHQKLTCTDCNQPAKGFTPSDVPVCYACMDKRFHGEA